ncbi:hypothetical protein CDAR_125941 [Caerostris darwini]|uniref:Uncharacterized protein n=1 Tax=Caerostris darwini TaxID=1538125 RepID=A0AAV4VQ23_9ARAC|nr:hypothetical protein CDAR_125941 [Caerostris darwini]
MKPPLGFTQDIQSRTKRSEECNCKNAGGRTLENEWGCPQIGGEDVGDSEILKSHIPLRILTFSSIDSKRVGGVWSKETEGCCTPKPFRKKI